MFSHRLRARLTVALSAWLLAAAPALAALTAEVRDTGGMFKPETIKEANAIIRAIKHDHGQDLLVESYPGIPADKKAEYEKVKDNKEKRKHFFAEWARARFRAAEVNGVYILITKDPGYLQIEVGNVTAERAFTMDNRDHLEALMLKDFKAKDYDKGLLDGVEYVRKAMDENLKTKKAAHPAPAAPPPTGFPGPTTPARPSLLSHGGWLGLLCIGLVVIAGIWVLFAIIRGLSARRSYGPAGYGGPGYGGPAYGGGYGYQGGGGFLSGMLGGLFGGAAGGWLYDHFFRGGGGTPAGGYGGQATPAGGAVPDEPQPQDTDASGVGGDFGPDTGDGGDTGAGGDFGGGDDTGGGDFGGGDTGGGGDFGGGGDTGGGDF
jgi:uncharacterized membrane protein YgcG